MRGKRQFDNGCYVVAFNGATPCRLPKTGSC